MLAFSGGLWASTLFLAPVVLGKVLQLESYNSRDARGRWSMENSCVSMLYNILAVYISVNATIQSCGDDDRFPVKDTDWKVARWFFSENCSH